MTSSDQDTIQSVETAFKIIELLRQVNGAGVTEIAEELDIPASTVHNHLHTLQQAGYVSNEKRKYRVGPKFIYLGDHVKGQLDIFSIGESYIEDLAKRTGEVANLMIESGGFGIYLKVARGEDALSLESYSRRREYLHCTAAGKSILAFESEEKIDEVIEEHGLVKFTENTITERKQLHNELENVRSAGYSFDDRERIEGLRCVGAPLLNKHHDVFGAVSVSGPIARMDDNRFRGQIPELVCNIARSIEIEINHS